MGSSQGLDLSIGMLHLPEFGKVFEKPINGYQPELSKLIFNFHHEGKRFYCINGS